VRLKEKNNASVQPNCALLFVIGESKMTNSKYALLLRLRIKKAQTCLFWIPGLPYCEVSNSTQLRENSGNYSHFPDEETGAWKDYRKYIWSVACK
jgi:hypothetical protein